MKNLFYLLPVLSCFACNDGNNSNQAVKSLTHSDLNLKDEYIGKGGDIIAYGDGIIGIEDASSLAPLFIIRGDSVTHLGNRGQGPDDLIYPYPIQYLDEDVFGVYDGQTNKYKEIAIPRDGDVIRVIKSMAPQKMQFKVLKTAYNQYLSLSYDKGLFNLIDETGKELAFFFEYPYKDSEEKAISNHIRAWAYQGVLATSPQNTKCVYTSFFGEIIHFYDIQKDNISLIGKIENIYPVYEPVTGVEADDHVISSRESIYGYISVSATDQYVYALYCGRTIDDIIKAGDGYGTKQLRKFDWTGKQIETYELDVLCQYICTSGDGKKLWAIALTPEATPVYFDLTGDSADEAEELRFRSCLRYVPVDMTDTDRTLAMTDMPDADNFQFSTVNCFRRKG